ncbi:hypothetical protein LCGC14_1226400 [marine sediment metagenome]|uniref:PD-(D/E)XK endonuclease-like domain-containing protein n=1 Tax=marine sediment metagenome TaxID=412755 RepID=A0A0F9LWY6_9ZZZZ
MTDLTPYLPAQSETVKAIFDHYKKVGDAEPIRGYLGASIIGHPCSRYLWYTFRHCCKPEFDGRIRRLFETGNLAEDRFVENLVQIGVTVYSVVPGTNEQQFEVKALHGHFSGHMDGCALGIPEAPKTWHVLEFKTHNTKSFANLKRQGVQKAKPQHYAQIQIYMHLTGMTRALYLAVNKDTDDLYSERIRYDAEYATQLMEKAEGIIVAITPPERVGRRPDSYHCKWCDTQSLCWGYQHEKDILKVVPKCSALPIPALSCRQCWHAEPVMSGQFGQWACKKHKRSLSPECQVRLCEDHLVLPGLLTIKEPPGGYSSKELQKLPVSLLKNKMITTAKNLFSATVTDCQQDVLHRYPEGGSRTIWKGPTGELEAAWDKKYGEKLLGLTPIARCNLPFHNAAEFEGGRVAIVWKEKEQIGTTQAEIREEVE